MTRSSCRAACRPLFLLALITAIAAALRFAFIDRQPLRDEEILSGVLTPMGMRIGAACAGMLMVPAIYLLARHWLSARAALVPAAFCACSALLVSISRDATLDAVFWFAATVSAGCLLSWLTTESRIAWLTWVASSTIAIGLSAWGVPVFAIELIALLARRRTIVIEREQPGPAIASLQFWTAAAGEEGRIALLFCIGVMVCLAGHAWAHHAWPAAPSTAMEEFIPSGTGLLFAFRWSPDMNPAGIAPAVLTGMTIGIAVAIALLILAAAARWFRVPAQSVISTLLGMVLAVNLVQVAARVFVRTSPPVDQLARDLVDGRHAEGSIATYVNPGAILDGLSARSPALLYELGGSASPRFHAFDPAEIVTFPRLKRVIVWSGGGSEGSVSAPPAGDWKLLRDNTFVVFDPWTWRRLKTWRRREFVKPGPLAPPPMEPPATTPSLSEEPTTRPGAV